MIMPLRTHTTPRYARSLAASAALLSVVASVGCTGRPARVPMADIDYEASARAALTTYDADGDGSLGRAELAACPALVTAFDRIDTDADTRLGEAEIAGYLRRLQESGVAMVSWTLRIMVDGKPIEGAHVSLEPAEFLHPGMLPAEGVTDRQGLVTLAVAEEHRPAPHARVLHCGLYNARVSPDGDRSDSANGAAERGAFGVEVRPEGQADYTGAVIHLTSK